jgi:pyridoxal phosphate enzyme (YggS family)
MKNVSWNENILEENINRVLERIEAATLRSGRKPKAVRLVAISKGQDTSKIREAYALGLRDFGENRVLEALAKQEQLADLEDICWHMVGHIQSRKASLVVPHFSFVHSIDRMKIAERLDIRSGQVGYKLPAFLECNVSGEETKGGWDLQDRSSWEGILPRFEAILALSNLRIQGLMTMAPFTEDVDWIRSVFHSLRELRDYLALRLPGNWQELSMGMTDDYEIAIEEGATMVRIGRAIFGERSYV